MTWVIGASTMFGNGLLISDVRISNRTREHWDILQKTRILGPMIVAGFSGDVEVGLSLLDDLEALAQGMEPMPGEIILPRWVVDQWSPRAQRCFTSFRDAQPVSILLVGLERATDQLGPTKACVATLKSPKFQADWVAGGNQVRSIGSGSDVDRYKESLQHWCETRDFNYLKFELNSPGGFATVIASLLHRDVHLHPQDTVSTFLQCFVIRPDGIFPCCTVGMPHLAQTWNELIAQIGASRSSALVA